MSTNGPDTSPINEWHSDMNRHRSELDSYDENGFAVFRDVLAAELVQDMVAHIDWLLERNPELRPEELGNHLMPDDPFWLRLVCDDRLLDIAELFIGPNIALFASHYIAKRPFDGQEVLWHQDGSYWPLEPMEVVTLWLAADGVNIENGCMRVLPGTQHSRLLSYEELEQRPDDTNVLKSGISPEDIDDSEAVDILLSAGDVSVHHPNVVHGSNANASPRWRRGLTIRYIPATTRIVHDGQWVSAFMLRGEATVGVNSYLPLPEYDESQHMPFHDAVAWNEKARNLNLKYAKVINESLSPT